MPRSIKIFGKRILIKYKDILDEDTSELETQGIYDLDTSEITIRKNLKGDEKIRVELHEYGHALIHRLGLHNTSINPDLEEIIVDGYARFLTETFILRYKK